MAWLNAGLAALGGTDLSERDKLAAVMAVLHFVRGAAALNIEAGQVEGPEYPALLRRFVDAERFPALAAALEAGVFDAADDDHLADFHSGLRQLSTAWPREWKRTVDYRRPVCEFAVAATRVAVQESSRRWEYAESGDKQTADHLLSAPRLASRPS